MKIRIKRVAPLQAGKMLAAFYALACVVVVPILLVVALFGPKQGGMPLVMVVVFPLLYVIAGFVAGVVGSFIYNLVAGWIGGMEVVFEEEA